MRRRHYIGWRDVVETLLYMFVWGVLMVLLTLSTKGAPAYLVVR
jgi:hypothetical protein